MTTGKGDGVNGEILGISGILNGDLATVRAAIDLKLTEIDFGR